MQGDPQDPTTPLPRRYRPVLDFFAMLIISAGWLVIGLGGLCTLGTVLVGGATGAHWTLWAVPMTLLALGGLLRLTGLLLERAASPKRDRPPLDG